LLSVFSPSKFPGHVTRVSCLKPGKGTHFCLNLVSRVCCRFNTMLPILGGFDGFHKSFFVSVPLKALSFPHIGPPHPHQLTPLDRPTGFRLPPFCPRLFSYVIPLYVHDTKTSLIPVFPFVALMPHCVHRVSNPCRASVDPFSQGCIFFFFDDTFSLRVPRGNKCCFLFSQDLLSSVHIFPAVTAYPPWHDRGCLMPLVGPLSFTSFFSLPPFQSIVGGGNGQARGLLSQPPRTLLFPPSSVYSFPSF